MSKEATARIKINKLMEESGWRFFDNEKGKANIRLEPNVKIQQEDIDAMGKNYEKTTNGFIDYLLLDENDKPFIVVEAKKAEVHPLDAKEQARKYANNERVKYVILTNGDMHYFWNLEKGNPDMISTFPTYESLKESKALKSDIKDLKSLQLDKYYVAVSQTPELTQNIVWKEKNDALIRNYCMDNDIRVLRDYQLQAIKSVQNSIINGNQRFLLEMATGTGKTLTACGIAKMFIRSDIARRVLFLVDRLELENQAYKDLTKYLSKDGIKTVIYKQEKDDWKSADIVVSTIQSFTFYDKYKNIFTPSDFDLVISDEAHRSLGANNKAVFEYFMGYKLGLTATPKNYLKKVNLEKDDPREIEKRQLLDTYHIFGCDSGVPTFSYTLNDGIKDNILINPTVIDARTDITTELLSKEGLVIKCNLDDVEVDVKNSDGSQERKFSGKNFEKKFFSDATNHQLCKIFMENALRDPITNEIGKSIVFCVSISHARKITDILNRFAMQMFPNKYNSDFAVQITSNMEGSQQNTINFSNNNLNGNTKWLEDYTSSKTRVAVTVGMMTTGYDCSDILNLCLMRPVYSPTEFIQMKGRGTRLYKFKFENKLIKKETFKLFDFFAICEYFEEEFNYDEKIKISMPTSGNKENFEKTQVFSDVNLTTLKGTVHTGIDELLTLEEEKIDSQGMKIDRMFYQGFEEKMEKDTVLQKLKENLDIDSAVSYLQEDVFDKPNEYYNIKKLEEACGIDRKLTVKEVVMKLFGLTPRYKMQNEKLDEEFENFKLRNKEQLVKVADKIYDIEELFKAYILDEKVRRCVKSKDYVMLVHSPIKDNFRNLVDVRLKNKNILEYISDYVADNDINCENFRRIV